MARRPRREEGLTLVEVMVAAVLMGVVASLTLSVLFSVQRSVGRQEVGSRNNDEARLALVELDREVRSANLIYDPASEPLPGYLLRLYSQTDAPYRSPPFQCVQYLVRGGRLLKRSWPPGHPEAATGWRVVAEGLVNEDLDLPPFSLDPDPLKRGRTVQVRLVVDLGGGSRAVRVETSLTGRNTAYNYPPESCAAAPAL